MQNLQIPTAEEISNAVRCELTKFFSEFKFNQLPETDEMGKGAEFASKITGKAVPTIYDLVHKRLIPHSKRGKDLYFSRAELIEWLKAGRRRTQDELALEAETFSPNTTRRKSIITR